jgi:hypothetical protein
VPDNVGVNSSDDAVPTVPFNATGLLRLVKSGTPHAASLGP